MANDSPHASARRCFPRYAPDEIVFDTGVVSDGTPTPRHNVIVRTDGELTHAVLRALHEEPDLPAEGLTVRAVNGHVTLEGCVQSFYHRDCAERAARFVDGVRALDNRIDVKAVVSAADIKRHVVDQLQYAVLAEARNLQVRAADGRVTLVGTVSSARARATAEEAARSLRGVVSVDNQLQVASD